MTALKQFLTERRNNSLRARVGRRWNGKHGRCGEQNTKSIGSVR